MIIESTARRGPAMGFRSLPLALGLLAACATSPAVKDPALARTDDLKGTVTVTDRGSIRIHTYTSPADAWLVNTQII